MKPAEEHVLVGDWKRGDRDAFDELLRRHQETVYRVAFGFTGSRDAALDVAQTVFLKAWRNASGFRQQASLRTWLVRIAANESLTWLKRQKRDAPRSLGLDDAYDIAAPEEDAEDALIARDNASRISALIERLGERQRAAIVLRYFEGCSIDEIAAVLGATTDVTRNTLYRAHQKLHTLWRKCHGNVRV